LLLAIMAVIAVGPVTGAQKGVELTDDQIENIVRRSYQYVAMYNVNNKFAMEQGGWNTVDADTELKATRCGRSHGPTTTRSTSAACWICATTP